MRFAFTAAASCLGLTLWIVEPAAPQSVAPAFDASASGNPSDAEKHAKRTACLKEAKARKLVGPQKTAYVKDCIAADKPLTTSTTPAAPAG
jgi:hypothetical protein